MLGRRGHVGHQLVIKEKEGSSFLVALLSGWARPKELFFSLCPLSTLFKELPFTVLNVKLMRTNCGQYRKHIPKMQNKNKTNL